MSKDKEKEKIVPEEELSFDEKLDIAEDQVSIELYKSLLKLAYDENKLLRNMNEKLVQEKINFRDEIARDCFIQQYKEVATLSAAVEEAYRAADTFMNVRDRGLTQHIFEVNPEKTDSDETKQQR